MNDPSLGAGILAGAGPGGPTVRAVIDAYLDHARRKLAASTLTGTERDLARFVADHGDRPMADCLPAHLELWLDGNEQWKSDWTRRRLVAVVNRPFNWATRLRLIKENPFRGVATRCGEAGRPMTDAEYQRCLAHSAPEFRRLLVFLRFSGCRPGEARALCWANVDLDRKVVILAKHKTAKTTKDRRPRVIALHQVAVLLLAGLGRRQGVVASDHAFLNRDGRPWSKNSLALRFGRLRGRAGLPADCRLYGLRHGFGTTAIMNGVDIKTLAELMGHTTTRMTEHYVHLAGEGAHLQAALKKAMGGRKRAA